METQNTNNQNQKSNTVFYEYPEASSFHNGHFITVMQKIDGKRKVAGRIFRSYDVENKKMNYTAKDWAGNPIFEDVKDLYVLKKQFIEHAKTLALTIPKDPQQLKDKEVEDIEREDDLKEIRERKGDKEQERGLKK